MRRSLLRADLDKAQRNKVGGKCDRARRENTSETISPVSSNQRLVGDGVGFDSSNVRARLHQQGSSTAAHCAAGSK